MKDYDQTAHGPKSTKYTLLQMQIGPFRDIPLGIVPAKNLGLCKVCWKIMALGRRYLPSWNIWLLQSSFVWPQDATLSDWQWSFAMWYTLNIYSWGRHFGLDLGYPLPRATNKDFSCKVVKEK